MQAINTCSRFSGQSFNSRPDRKNRTANIALLALTLAAIVLGASTPGHAGTATQGTATQGTATQGTATQGTATQGTATQGTATQGTATQGPSSNHSENQDSLVSTTKIGSLRMHGREFLGVKSGGHEADITLIKIARFRGDEVDALVWRRGTDWTQAVLHAREMVGIKWSETHCDDSGACEMYRYRITGAEMDTSRNTMPAHSSNRDVWLYDLETTSAMRPSAEDWRPACAADARGLSKGLFITGDWHEDGSSTTQGYTFSCTGGVIAKCIRSWGYKPWKTLATRDGRRVALLPLHRACTRAARADYCGDGRSHTRNGTIVDMFDRYGFNVPDDNPGFAREAGFSPDGATWVARTRWPVGARSRALWIDLPHCRRPRYAALGRSGATLIQVSSHPEGAMRSSAPAHE